MFCRNSSVEGRAENVNVSLVVVYGMSTIRGNAPSVVAVTRRFPWLTSAGIPESVTVEPSNVPTRPDGRFEVHEMDVPAAEKKVIVIG
jgi:hypothetical protein